MKYTLVISILLFSFGLFGQFDILVLEDRPCSNDSGFIVTQPTHYDIFQTENNEIGGTKLPQCISTFLKFGSVLVDTSTIVKGRRLFVKSRANEREEYFYLEPNIVLSISMENGSYSKGNLEGDNILTYTISSPQSESKELLFTDSEILLTEDYMEICLPTTKFEEDQFLTSIAYSLVIDDDIYNDDDIRLPQFYLVASYFETIDYDETEIFASETVNDSSIIFFWSDIFFGTSLLLHTEEGWPGNDNWSYHDISVFGNNSPLNIRIIFEEYSNILYQPFTSLRGGMTEDSTRHHLDLVLADIEYCLVSSELVISNGNSLIMSRGSSINMYGKSACIMLTPNSELVIDKNHNVSLGKNEQGILALKAGSSLELKEGASLYFDTKLQYLVDNKSEKPRIILRPGSLLTFGENAYFVQVRDSLATVDIYMEGGEVDLSDLLPRERAKINLIYTKKVSPFLSLRIFPNPTEDYFLLDQVDYSRNYRILDMMGKVVRSGLLLPNQFRIDVRDVHSGTFILSINESGSFWNAMVTIY